MFGFFKRSRNGAAILSLPYRRPSMDQIILSERLEQAEHHVAKGVRCIARQRTVIANLERNGHDTTQARALLAQFQSTQVLHIVGRDELKKELEKEQRGCIFVAK
jgi:hypothetical protein